MAIIKHIAVHQSPLRFLRYILNSSKTDGMRFATGLELEANVKSAYMGLSSSFENFSGEKFYKKSLGRKNADDNSLEKEKVRLHHYIQSFKPGEVAPDEAHKIGVEWARKVFGENRQVLVTTHVDRSHIHNHFAVAAYDLDGKKWYGNKTTLKRCRDISDKICKSHGLSVIEKPTYRANKKYSDWLARQKGVSWKTRLCYEIDKLVLRDDVKSVEDLAGRLREKGYAVNLGKYLSVKAAKNRKAIRTYRLGDGYAVEELRYRIVNKNREISLQAIAKLQGIQKEYALCLRELQIIVYRKPDNNHKVTYRELRRNAELLTFLCDNKIQSVGDFENAVNAAAEKSYSLKKSRERLSAEIREREEILEHGARFIELNKIRLPTAAQLKEFAEIKFLAKFKLHSEEDIADYGRELEKLKSDLSDLDGEIQIAEKEKSEVTQIYQTYLRQMQSDFDFILERMKREREEIKAAEQQLDREQERQSANQNYYR